MSDCHARGRWFIVGSSLCGGEYSLSCTCGWRSDWEMHGYAAERSLRTHIEEVTGTARPDLAPTWSLTPASAVCVSSGTEHKENQK